MSVNDVTGDRLVSKAVNDAYAEGHDRIWGKSKVESAEYRAEQTEKNAKARAMLDASLPAPPPGYTAEELEQDNPYNQWMYEK